MNDSRWTVIEPMFPRAGNRSKWEKRELVNAVRYFVDNGYKWKNLPRDFPPYTTTEASRYFHIGRKKMRQLVSVHMDSGIFIRNGVKVPVKKKRFEAFLDNVTAI